MSVRTARSTESTLDPITLSVLISALSGIAEEMGAVLIHSASSSNIKERQDCSCALFDSSGRMVAQAEHIPVHLGAMAEAVAAVIERDPRPGDVHLLNDPFSGGTHLPDITVVSTIAGGQEIVGYTVSRAHHSDVGGMHPGSMPSDSQTIFQEGIVIPPVRLVSEGRPVDDIVRILLANVRTPDLRRADLLAQMAANDVGAKRLCELIARHGISFMRTAFDDVLAYTERRTRSVLAELPDGVYSAATEVEGDGVTADDIAIQCTAEISGDRVHFDFTGTADAVAGNVNCPLAVTRSACLFALRVLLPDDVPTNGGIARAIEVTAPPGSLVNALRPSAVVAGNVETSQRIADVVLEALAQAVALPAAGQGTMNNTIIGGSDWTYYETIGGGQGGSSLGEGASGVHVGMSNTLNTPIEALELEFPLHVERYELRDGSGGRGRHAGGDGIVRQMRVLRPATLCLITDRRRHPPLGRAGGGPGEPGRNLLDGTELPAKITVSLDAGQVVTVETPGGGGWGQPLEA